MAMFDTPDQLARAILEQRIEDIEEQLISLGAVVDDDDTDLETLHHEQRELIAERTELDRHLLLLQPPTETRYEVPPGP